MADMAKMNGNGAPILEAQMLYRQALEMIGKGRYDAAVGTLKKVVMIAPRFARAFNEMGNCFDILGRYPEALEAFKKVLEIDPLYEGVSLKRDAISRKIVSSYPGQQCYPQKTHGTQRGGKDEDHSFMDDLAAVAGIKHPRLILLPCT
jgi:tetratricopeptide (TPR) repeat protein